jgi:LAO/AO transport system kinase
MLARLRTDAPTRARVKKIEAEVAAGRLTPSLAAEEIVELLR